MQCIVNRQDRTLRIEFAPQQGVKRVEIRFESYRNRTISKFSDISPCTPFMTRKHERPPHDIWYPVVDIDPQPDMVGVAVFEDWENERYVVNEMFHKEEYPLTHKVQLNSSILEHWENSFFVSSPYSRLLSFYLSCTVSAETGINRSFELLSNVWGGNISLYDVTDGAENRLLYRVTLDEEYPVAQAPIVHTALTTENLLRALNGTIAFTLRSQNQKADSPTEGGLNLFYDFDAKMFRSSHWVWTWGISIQMLLRAAQSHLPLEIDPDHLRRVAVQMGEASLRFQATRPGNPMDGVVCVRQVPSKLRDYHTYGCYSHADSLFLAGWGWIPLYRETGDDKFLHATRRLSEATQRVLKEFVIPPQDYYDNDQWADHGINESGFGAKGLAELYAVTRSEKDLAVAKEFMQQHFDIYQMENGLWHRFYKFETKEVVPCNYWTRGMGWGMMALLAMDQILPNDVYIEYAKKMAEHLMKYQHSSGCWAHQFTSSIEQTGACEKATSLWCMLFYQLYAVTHDERHLETARKALLWCMNRQYFGEDPDASGALLGYSANSGIDYRNWYNMSCSYSAAFFGMALLSELEIRNYPSEEVGELNRGCENL